MKLLLSCLILLLALQPTFACINGSEKPEKPKGSAPVENLRLALGKRLVIDGVPMVQALHGATDLDGRNRYAVGLIYIGRVEEAGSHLEKLEKDYPGEYAVAANLGTAYELSGDNESALHWIKEGIRRNPASHHGTEWLHVQILEAKIAHAKNPRYFETNSVLDLKRNPKGDTRNYVVAGREMPLETIKKALDYQLGERLQFVKERDWPVASLLFDYAAIEAAERSFESARDLLELAIHFGYPQAQGKPLLTSYNRGLLWEKAKAMLITMGLSAVVLCVLGFLFVKWVNRPLQP